MWWRGHRPAWLRGDLIAGLTVWAVLVPESLAYVSIAGVPALVGYTPRYLCRCCTPLYRVYNQRLGAIYGHAARVDFTAARRRDVRRRPARRRRGIAAAVAIG